MYLMVISFQHLIINLTYLHKYIIKILRYLVFSDYESSNYLALKYGSGGFKKFS